MMILLRLAHIAAGTFWAGSVFFLAWFLAPTARHLGPAGGEALIRGRRYPFAGTITMDQALLDLGDDPVALGDEVVLLGHQGDLEITADEWADRLDTINWEVVCGFGPRLPRRYVG